MVLDLIESAPSLYTEKALMPAGTSLVALNLVLAQVVVFLHRSRLPVARGGRYSGIVGPSCVCVTFTLLSCARVCVCVQVVLMNRDEQLFMSAMAAYSRGEKIIE